MPYSPAPFPKTVRAIMALVSWKLRPKVETTPTTIMMTRMSLRPRTYRMPSRIWPRARVVLGRRRSWSTFITTSATIVAAKVTPLIMKTQPVPTHAIISPATPGPISRAALNDALLRPTAFESLSCGTSSATNVCRTGPSTAETQPSRVAKT